MKTIYNRKSQLTMTFSDRFPRFQPAEIDTALCVKIRPIKTIKIIFGRPMAAST